VNFSHFVFILMLERAKREEIGVRNISTGERVAKVREKHCCGG
jgi:hypothetical protein